MEFSDCMRKGLDARARALAALGPNVVRMFLKPSPISVPNFTTFYLTVQWAAIDNLDRRRRRRKR